MDTNLLDATQVVAATAVLGFLIVLPGGAVASATGVLGADRANSALRWVSAIVLGLAVLPAALSLAARFFGLGAALGLDLAVALGGLFIGRWPGKPARAWVLALLAWTAIVILAIVDFEYRGKLYHTALAMDLTKHVATVNAIVNWGVPPIDPYFLRPGRSGYYYFSHTLAALPVVLTAGWIDARAAVAASIVWSGAGVFGLAALAWERCRLGPSDSKRIASLLLVLLLARNLDIIPAALVRAAGIWPINIERWNEEVLSWPFSCFWVPQHIVSLIAGMVGLLVLADRPEARRSWTHPIVAGIAFASCVGASIWVGLAVALTCVVWLASRLIRGERREALLLAAAGCIAAVLLLPQALDIVAGRPGEHAQIALDVRGFAPWDRAVLPGLVRELGRLVLLPLNYFLEFGAFFVGSIMFWRRFSISNGTEAARVLALAALAGLALGSFARSAILNNDLGWRVLLLTQFSALLWTAAVVVHIAGERGARVMAMARWPASLCLLVLVGFAGNAYNLVAIRAYPELGPRKAFLEASLDRPDVDYAARRAYAWLNRHEPLGAVVQHNPTAATVFDFGLYGRNRVAVSDEQAVLYGAGKPEVDERRRVISPIFLSPIPAADVRARAASEGIDVLFVSAADPVWAEKSSWVWSSHPLYADARVRLISVDAIGRDDPQ